MQVGYEKVAVYSTNISLQRDREREVLTCCKQSAAGPWQVGDTHRW